jgi:hypothetical protein
MPTTNHMTASNNSRPQPRSGITARRVVLVGIAAIALGGSAVALLGHNRSAAAEQKTREPTRKHDSERDFADAHDLRSRHSRHRNGHRAR